MSPPLEKKVRFLRFIISLPKAIEAVGAGKKIFTPEEMIEILRRLASKLDRPVLASDIDKLFRSGVGPSHRANSARIRRNGESEKSCRHQQ